MKTRIWELDALRGLCVLAMVGVHLLFDLTELFGLLAWQPGPGFSLLKQWGGTVFFLLSGCCATLSRRGTRRGLSVLLCGGAVSAVTGVPVLLGWLSEQLWIPFGALHCLGTCMLLWSGLKKANRWFLWALTALSIGLGLYFMTLPGVSFPWLLPLGLYPRDFSSPDYFPLFPYLGFFLLGAFAGKALYPTRRTLLPNAQADHPALKFLQWTGRCALPIYLFHQPILMGLCALLTLL